MENVIEDYYSAYVLSYDGYKLSLNLITEKVSLEEIVYDIPIFEDYMDDKACIKTIELDGMKCSTITIWFKEYGTYCYHERTNLLGNRNIGIQKIYRDYDWRIIMVFDKFYLTSIQKLCFGMYVFEKNVYRFKPIEACFEQ